jgi:hypothetical protein
LKKHDLAAANRAAETAKDGGKAAIVSRHASCFSVRRAKVGAGTSYFGARAAKDDDYRARFSVVRAWFYQSQD